MKLNLPNKITMTRIFMIPVFMLFVIPLPKWLIASSNPGFVQDQLRLINHFIRIYGNFIGAFIFIIAASTDGIDGYIARKRNLVTKLGIFLDPIADKLLVTAALIALVQRGVIGSWSAIIIISREFIVTGFRLVASGESVVISANFWGKVKTVTQIVAISFSLLENYPFKFITDFPFHRYIMLIAVIVTIYSGYRYIADNIHILKSSET